MVKENDNKNIPEEIESDSNKIEDTDNLETQENSEFVESGDEAIDGTAMAVTENTNTHLRRLISSNYLEYASYVIKDRAIPDVNDGLKPVQRRILWSLYKMDDGKFHKVANVVGHAMQFHPHGDASIYMALVNLANKEYFIEKQGNFGNIFTGDAPAAARYIEARLTPLAKETLFNPDITDFVDSYDGRNKEPIFFPAKVPALLMSGQEGIAPGMTTMILPHNFKELLEAQIAILRKEPFELFPDFLQGGIMNVSGYDDGNGKITLRAKVDIDGRKLIIRELPATTTTEKLIDSVEKAVNKNKLKIASINDYTGENVEIEIVPARGHKPEETLKILYAYTDCSVSVSSSLLVIKDSRPVIMTVSDVLKYNTESLVEYLRMELQIELERLNEKYHEKTLERIFIENRIYKRIEECQTYDLVLTEVRKGLNKFKDLLKREITVKDIEHLLAIPIRRISRFDMNRNKKDIDEILKAIKEIEKNLNSIIRFSIEYIESLIERFAKNHPRRTEIEDFKQVDKREAALSNIKVGWDRKNCYIGTSIKSEDTVRCNEFDFLHCIEKTGKYKIIGISQKLYVGRLYYFNKFDKNTIFSIVYKDKKKNVYYIKRCCVNKFIKDKDYLIIPKGCQLELITTRENCLYECTLEKTARQKIDSLELNFSQVQMRTPAARGFRFTNKKILKFRFKGQVAAADLPPDDESISTVPVEIDDENKSNDAPETIDVVQAVTPDETPNISATPVEKYLKPKEESTPDKKQLKKDSEPSKEDVTPAVEARASVSASPKQRQDKPLRPAPEENVVITPQKDDSVKKVEEKPKPPQKQPEKVAEPSKKDIAPTGEGRASVFASPKLRRDKSARPLPKEDASPKIEPDNKKPVKPLPKKQSTPTVLPVEKKQEEPPVKKELAPEPPKEKPVKKEAVVSTPKEKQELLQDKKTVEEDTSKKDDDPGDDWGIVQPDLGF